MTRVVIIGGPPALRRLLRRILEAERDIDVVQDLDEHGEPLRALQESGPQVVTMHASALSTVGLRLIEQIMSELPLPILVLSDLVHDPSNIAVTQAIRRGALAAHALPTPSDLEGACALRAAIRLVAKIPVVRHPRSRPVPQTPAAMPPSAAPSAPAAGPDFGAAPAAEIIGIGSSAGGPAILSDILMALPKSFPGCVLVVQHLPIGFASPFAAFLRARVSMQVVIATEPLPLSPGVVILAPDDAHLVVSGRGHCMGVSSPPVNGHRPSVDLLFESMARVYGPTAVGIVLSGIGSDGTLGLRAIRERGGLTIAQDGQSAAVNGMPRSASESGAATLILAPAAISHALLAVCAPSGRGASHGD